MTDLLDALSIGGCQIHLMPTTRAERLGYFNCYVWTGNRLVYIDKNKVMSDTIPLKNVELLTTSLDALKTDQQSSLHLTAEQINLFITLNTECEHIPPTTDLKLIKTYYESPNLYVALTRIKRKHRHLEQLVELITDVKPERNWARYLTYGAVIAAVASVLYYLKDKIDLLQSWFERTMPLVSQWLGQTVHIMRNTPLFGVVSNGIPLVYAWYRMLFTDSPSTDWDPSIKLFFKTIEHAFPIIGYVLCYMAAGSMTIPAVTMFVAGAGIEIIHSIYTVIRDEQERWDHPTAPGTEYFSKAAAARADNLYERGLQISLTKLLANILTTALVVIWCVYPPSMVIALSCAVGAWVMGLIKSAALTHIKTTYANALQENIKTICTHYQLHQNAPQVGVSNVYVRGLEEENRELKQQRQALQEQLNISHMDGYRNGYRDGRQDRVVEEAAAAAAAAGEEQKSDLQANSLWNRGLVRRAINPPQLVTHEEGAANATL
ncbi:MAG TPA: hypothetical protein DDY37_05800 [Legionella sp.]|nr:hypothetical protein [Legionella sp.]